MDEKIEHRPNIRQGLIVHWLLLCLNLAVSGYIFFLSFSSQIRGVFILYLIGGIITVLPAPVLLYQIFALARATYVISRDGISIEWGLRTEDIPITEIEWVRHPHDLVNHIVQPPFRLPGAVLASCMDRDLGATEYIAAEKTNVVLIATHTKIYAISPGSQYAFINDFHRSAELGSFSPIDKQSSQPQVVLTRLVQDKAARRLLVIGLGISLLLLVAVSFIIPTRESVPLGLEALGVNREESPSERLILLPLLSLLFFFVDLGFGVYLYRKKGFRSAAYVVFFSSILLPISFSVLMLFILVFN